jgi:WD40 repeat protein
VIPGEGQEDTRARAGMPLDPAQRRIVEQFAGPRTRLLVTGSNRAQQPTVEVAHEALIRTWPRLRGWINASREKLRARAAVLQAKAEWEEQGGREDLLLAAGFQLERARALLAEPGDITVEDIREFIAVSSAREERERKEREKALAREEARVAEIKVLQSDKARQLATKERQLTTQAEQLARQEIALTHTQANLLAELSATKLLRGEFDSALRLASHGTSIDLALPSDVVKASPAAAALAAAVSAANWRSALGHGGPVFSAAFSPDGSRIVTASGDNTVRIWDAATAKEIAVLRGDENWIMTSAAFSPDGSRIVTASCKNPRVQGPAPKQPEAKRSGPLLPPEVTWSRIEQLCRIWDAASAKEIAVLHGHDKPVFSAAFSPDGSRIVTASWDKTARIWDAATAKEIAVLRGHEEFVLSAAFSPDGSRIVTASEDKTARVWDATIAKEIAVLRGQDHHVNSAAFSPNGSRIVTASWDKTARIWDAATSKEIAVLGHDNGVLSAAFSPDGSRIVTASGDKTARIWDAATAKAIAVLRGHDNRVRSAAFSPDGSRILTASLDTRIWDAATANEIAVLPGHDFPVNSVSFSPDGSRIVTASWDKTTRIWDAATAKEIAVLRGHDSFVNSAAFSSDGSRIVTASWDKTARIWDAATSKEIAVLRGHDGRVTSAAFSPDGSRILTASEDMTARIWDAHLQTMSAKLLLTEACARLSGLTKLTRDEMRFAGYPDSMPEIDACE